MKKVKYDGDKELSSFNNGGVGIENWRLKQLTQLVNEYDSIYLNLNRMSPAEQRKHIPAITEIYIPNVLHDISAILTRLALQERYIEHLFKQNDKYKKQIRKAYAYLQWTNNDYFDVAECLPDDPAELNGIDPKEIITPPRRKALKTKTAKPKKTTAKKEVNKKVS